MNFDFTEDQRTIKATARELLAGALAVRARARGRRGRALTTRRCGASCASSAGPASRSPRSTAARGSAPSSSPCCWRSSATRSPPMPLLGTALAALAIEHAGDDEQRARWLPGLASGELTGAFGGARDLVADARRRRACSCSSRTAAPRVRRARGRRRRAGRRDRPDAPLRARARRRPGARGDVEAALDRAAAAIAAELVGVCQRALDMTVAYVKERRQFGVPVGAFQAVAHRCAQMLLRHGGRPLGGLLRRLGGRRRARAAGRGGRAGPRGGGRRPASRSPARRSRRTAASASPGRPTCTGCSSARSSTRRCWAARPGPAAARGARARWWPPRRAQPLEPAGPNSGPSPRRVDGCPPR